MKVPVEFRSTARGAFPSKRGTDVPPGVINLYWLGQAGFLLETRALRILIDPYLSDSLAVKYRGKRFPHIRMMAAPVQPENLFDIDLVLCTHGHSDHVDPGSVGAIAAANPQCRFVVPEAVRNLAIERGIPPDRLIGANAGLRLHPAEGCTVDPIPAAHEALQCDARGCHLYLGYIVRVEGLAVYHSGDCCPYPALEEELRAQDVDLALLPINGRDSQRAGAGIPGNFTADEAVSLVRELGIPFALGHHFGMFEFNTVSPDEVRELIKGKYPEMEARFLLPGMESRYVLVNQARG